MPDALARYLDDNNLVAVDQLGVREEVLFG